MPESRSSFYQEHLNRVSRSFAFCIEELKEPLREQVGLAYILCRIVDTVEDALWEDKKDQTEAFENFLAFLSDPPEENRVREWTQKIPNSIPGSEKALLTDAEKFFTDLHELPTTTQRILRSNIMNMTRGMARFCDNQTGKNISVRSLQETNQYCFFVAAVVGELLTQLCEELYPTFKAGDHTYLRAAHFGLFLQKVNLLKDQMTDVKEGRELIENRSEVRESLIEHAIPALNYICEIPVEHSDYRTFSAWSLFLGLASLPYIDRSWESQEQVKISRLDAMAVLGEVKLNIDDNDWLREKFAESLPRLGGGSPQELAPAPWIKEIYRGTLRSAQLASLGIEKAWPMEIPAMPAAELQNPTENAVIP